MSFLDVFCQGLCVESVEATIVSTPSSSVIAPTLVEREEHAPTTAFLDNLRDLIELSESGEQVAWPAGLTALDARQLLNTHPIFPR